MKKENLGLYIHIPFCTKKCDYCDFVSCASDFDTQFAYMEALFAEIDQQKLKFADCSFDTVYIGGGTPSCVFTGFIEKLTRKLHASFNIKNDFEYTIEVNPSSLTKEKLIEYKQNGIKRISIGVQSLDQDVLASVGRIQSLKNVKKAFKLMHKMQFENISADIMIGLPHQRLTSVQNTVAYLYEQNVKHISVYSLQVERKTALYERVRRGLVRPLSEKKTVKMYDTLYKMLEVFGFYRYEISNFARKTYKSKHNLKYWNGVDYLGLGCSAHSYYDDYRYANTDSVEDYMAKLQNNESPQVSSEFISKQTKRVERLMLALRTTKGLNLKEYNETFKENLLKTRKEIIDKLLSEKMIVIEKGYLRIADDYMYVSNQIILELI